jgi:hypothetical protein
MKADYKMAFYVNSLFQLFVSCVLRKMFGVEKKECLLYQGLSASKSNAKKLEEFFTLSDDFSLSSEEAFFFSPSFPSYAVFKSINTRRRTLVYEGITTYLMDYWLKHFHSAKGSDFDRILLPLRDPLDEEYRIKFEELKIRQYFSAKNNLISIVNDLNLVFNYTPDFHWVNDTIFFDRYFFSSETNCINETQHRLLIVKICNCFDNRITVKLHPSERQNFYLDDFEFNVSKGNVPYELLFMNALVKGVDLPKRYVIWNSSAAINCASFFGKKDFTVVCLVDLLRRYGHITESTVTVNDKYNKRVLSEISRLEGFEISFPRDFEQISS